MLTAALCRVAIVASAWVQEPMREIREILRLKWTLRRSHRQAARSVGVSPGSVALVVSRATYQGLTWEAVTALTDDALDEALWGPKLPLTAARTAPDPVHVHTELRGKGVTLELLHLEYLAQRCQSALSQTARAVAVSQPQIGAGSHTRLCLLKSFPRLQRPARHAPATTSYRHASMKVASRSRSPPKRG